MSRGVLYICWGKYNKQELQRSIDSLRPFGYDYHVAEIEDEGIGLAHKSRMYDLSPFDTTLFLDTDTEVRGNLDFGFEMAEQFGIACCIAPASSAYLAGREIGLNINKDAIQYNTGVIFFDKKKDGVNEVFYEWEGWCADFIKSKTNDQPTFSTALYEADYNPYVLPRNWNYRAKMRYEAKILHGELKILHAR